MTKYRSKKVNQSNDKNYKEAPTLFIELSVQLDNSFAEIVIS
ncbi:hypothetical protein [Halobacillus litoralis]